MKSKILTLSFILLTQIFCSNNVLADNIIKIGVVTGQTGPASKYARYSRLGLELAQKEINQSGGVNGKTIDLIFEDSQTSSAKSVTSFNGLVNYHKVDAVIGDLWGHLTSSMIPLANKQKVLLLSPTAMPHSVPLCEDYCFTLGHNVESMKNAYRQFFKQKPNIKTVALINWDNEWGEGYQKVFKKILKEFNIEIVDELATHDFNSELKSEVTRIILKNPDLIFVPFLAERVAKRLIEFKAETKILSTLNILEPLLDPNFNKSILEGIYYTDFTSSDEYLIKFKNSYQEDSQYESHLSYEALFSLAKAFHNNPNNPMAGLKQVKYAGVSGEIDFTNSNFGNLAGAKLFQIQEGKVILIKE